MRFYEIALIASPHVGDDGIKEIIEKIDNLLKKKRKKAEKGELLHIDDWGVRKLSYPIRKEQKGHYIILAVKCLPDTLSEVERNLKLMDVVLRFQTVRLEEEPRFEKPSTGEEEAKEGKEKAPEEVEAAGESAGTAGA